MTTCHKCGNKVRWTKEEGRWYCRNNDGTDHWDSCSQFVWNQIKTEGKKVMVRKKGERCHGYEHDKHGTKFYMMEGKSTKGKDYKPVKHVPSCTAAPWEDCNCAENITEVTR